MYISEEAEMVYHLTKDQIALSGLQVVYDVSRAIGERVIEVKIRCANCSVPRYHPLEDSKEYALAISSFIHGGGDGFDQFKKYAKKSLMVGK